MMKHEITHIAPLQAAKLMALLCLLFSLPVLVMSLLPLINTPGPRLRFVSGYLFALPVIYALAGFVVALVGAALYNLLARRVGGVVITLAPLSNDPSEIETQPAPL
jgi:hypothetical protein